MAGTERSLPTIGRPDASSSTASIDWSRASSVWRGHPTVVAAYHFGSTVRGVARPESDVDVAVVLEPEAAASSAEDELVVSLARLQNRLQRHLGLRKLDLVVLNHQGAVFQHNVLRTGRLIWDADRRRRVLFETQVISEYCDFLPTLRLIERYHIRGRRRRAKLI